MASIPVVELEHCRELALAPGSVFEFTSRFLSRGNFEPLLAKYALKQAVSSIPKSGADDSVKWAKLKWWSEELVADPEAPARHPILRALWLSGARAKLDNSLLLRLVSDALARIDMAPCSDEDAMCERLAEPGSTDIQLELSLASAEIDSQSLKLLGAATGLFGLVSSFASNHLPETSGLPLNVLAKFNVSVPELEDGAHTEDLAQIVEHLARQSLASFEEGMSGLVIQPHAADASHLRLRWAMEQRRLREISRDASGFLASGARYGPADAWFAWRFLRKLK